MGLEGGSEQTCIPALADSFIADFHFKIYTDRCINGDRLAVASSYGEGDELFIDTEYQLWKIKILYRWMISEQCEYAKCHRIAYLKCQIVCYVYF